MKKIDGKYLFWKVVIHLLLLVMTMALGFPMTLIMKNTVSALLLSKVASGVTLVLFLLLQYWLIQRSDLSGIKAKSYILGEGIAYGVVVLLGGVLLLIISKGISPVDFSFFAVPFLPTSFFSYFSGNILLGSLLQILCYPLFVLLLYVIKKKKDPSLCGGKRKLPSQDSPQ